MTHKIFIDTFNIDFSKERRDLISTFFITFSRFECALKASEYVHKPRGYIQANWSDFEKDIRDNVNYDRTPSLTEAVQYLRNNPPRVQALKEKKVFWKDRDFPIDQDLTARLGTSIRDIRNNLFHGGKFNGVHQTEISRNDLLLQYAIIILDEWLELNPTVRGNFLQLLH